MSYLRRRFFQNFYHCTCQGFGLIEILVASGLIGGLALFSAQLMQNQIKGSKTVEQRYEANDLAREIRNFLSDKDNCTVNLKGKSLNNTATPTLPLEVISTGLRDKSTPPRLIYNTGVKWGASGISIDKFEFGGPVFDSSSPPNPMMDRTHLTVYINKKNSYGPPVTSKAVIILAAQVDAANKLKSCYAMGGQDQIWTRATGTMDIYYSGGLVGIGTTRPVAPLHINDEATSYGAIMLGGNGGTTNHHLAQDSDGAFRIYNGTFGSGNAQMTVTGTGNVGIGTKTPSVALDVKGGIRPGSSTSVAACGLGQANGEGTQRYNYTTHSMEYCNGAAWLPLGGSKTLSYTNCAYSNWRLEDDNQQINCGPGQVMTGAGLRVNGRNEYLRIQCCDLNLN